MSNKIEDFGEKIGGARKDLWKQRGLMVADLDGMTEMEKDTYVKKDNIWQKPDYQQMVNDGISVRVAYFIKTIRDSIPPKPTYLSSMSDNRRAEIRENYISSLTKLRDLTMNVKTEDQVKSYFNDVMKQFAHISGWVWIINIGAEGVINNKAFKASQVSDFYKIDREITKKKFLFTDKQKALTKYTIVHFSKDEAVWDYESERYNPAGMVCVKVKDGYWNRYFYLTEAADKDINNWKNDSWLVSKTGSGRVFAKNFESKEQAEEYVVNIEKNTKETPKRKGKFIPPQLSHVRRKGGDDYRHGHNITGDDMLKTFGFHGGEFGNWLNDNDRQTNLNMSYDAFADLANALDIGIKDISLGGELSIAFGARGRAGAAAHYEPLRRVINLTKMSGAGSLAHEWGHALDHYVGRQLLDTDALATEGEANHFRSGVSVRTEIGYTKLLNDMKFKTVVDESTGLEKKIKTDFYKYSIDMDNQFAKEDKGYWQSRAEMFARAFACYVSDKLAEKGVRNDYLCGHSDTFKTMDGNPAYPVGEERATLNADFDSIFAALREREVLQTHAIGDAVMPAKEVAPIKSETIKESSAFMEAANDDFEQTSFFDKGKSLSDRLKEAIKIASAKNKVSDAPAAALIKNDRKDR